MTDSLRILEPSITGPLGIQIDPIEVFVTPRSGGYLKGSVLETDLSRVSAGVDNARIGDVGGSAANLIEPTANGARGGAHHVVLLEDANQGQTVKAVLEGEAWVRVPGHTPGPKMRPIIVNSPGTNHGLTIKGIVLDDKPDWVLAAWHSNRWGMIYDTPGSEPSLASRPSDPSTPSDSSIPSGGSSPSLGGVPVDTQVAAVD